MIDAPYANYWRSAAPGQTGLYGKARFAVRGVLISFYAQINRSLGDRFLRCLYCHYVFDDQKKDFDRILARLNKIGNFVTTDTLISMLSGETKIDGRYFHLSFDDGFQNNFTNALPLLRKHKIPAIFFVPSSLIAADYDTTADFCLNRTNYRSVIKMMSWEDIRKIKECGYEIGSHTRTHARLSRLEMDVNALEGEILGSKREIEAQLQAECHYISWPYGTPTDIGDSALEFIRNSGYRACFGAFRGSIRPKETDAFFIPRHHFEPQWPVRHIEFFARGNMEKRIENHNSNHHAARAGI